MTISIYPSGGSQSVGAATLLGGSRTYYTEVATNVPYYDIPPGYQPYDEDLTAIAASSGTDVLYYRSAADTWEPVTIDASLTFESGILSVT